MDWNLKSKMGQAAALSLVAFTGILNAADDAQMRNLDNRVTALEQKKGAGGMINPPARPVVKDGVDIFLTGEVLVWKAHQEDMTYAVKLANSGSVAGTPNSGKLADWKGKWSTGFRLGVGYNMEHDGWDVDLYWTRFNTSSRNHTTGDRHGVFAPQYVVQPETYAIGTTAAEAHDKKWRVRLDMLDLELGREFFVSKWLTIRPHMGLRNIWARQRMKVEYEDGTYATSVLATFLTGGREQFTSMKNNFWGIGLRGGLDSQWGLGCGVSIYGKLALSVLWGQMKIRQNSKVYNTGRTASVTADAFRDLHQVCKPVADVALGLRYDTTFSDDSYAFGIFAGWEHHYFWAQNKLFRFNSSAPTFSVNQNAGDLSTSGFNGGISFDF